MIQHTPRRRTLCRCVPGGRISKNASLSDYAHWSSLVGPHLHSHWTPTVSTESRESAPGNKLGSIRFGNYATDYDSPLAVWRVCHKGGGVALAATGIHKIALRIAVMARARCISRLLCYDCETCSHLREPWRQHFADFEDACEG